MLDNHHSHSHYMSTHATQLTSNKQRPEKKKTIKIHEIQYEFVFFQLFVGIYGRNMKNEKTLKPKKQKQKQKR